MGSGSRTLGNRPLQSKNGDGQKQEDYYKNIGTNANSPFLKT